jgi:hypothetical protein
VKPHTKRFGGIEMRFQEDGLDEVIARVATVHIERMDDNWFWIGIEDANGHLVHVHIGAKRARVNGTIAAEEKVR